MPQGGYRWPLARRHWSRAGRRQLSSVRQTTWTTTPTCCACRNAPCATSQCAADQGSAPPGAGQCKCNADLSAPASGTPVLQLVPNAGADRLAAMSVSASLHARLVQQAIRRATLPWCTDHSHVSVLTLKCVAGEIRSGVGGSPTRRPQDRLRAGRSCFRGAFRRAARC